MFGRVRASSLPAESLERPPCKIFKDDSLSIYEATLMKLKLGSKRNLSACSNEVGEMDADSNSSSLESEPMNIEVNCASSGASSSPDLVASSPHEEVMTLDTDCSSERSSISSCECNSAGTSKQPRSTEVSVLYLFSKFKRAHDAISSSSSEAMTVDSVAANKLGHQYFKHLGIRFACNCLIITGGIFIFTQLFAKTFFYSPPPISDPPLPKEDSFTQNPQSNLSQINRPSFSQSNPEWTSTQITAPTPPPPPPPT